jgi:hypothetical protein
MEEVARKMGYEIFRGCQYRVVYTCKACGRDELFRVRESSGKGGGGSKPAHKPAAKPHKPAADPHAAAAKAHKKEAAKQAKHAKAAKKDAEKKAKAAKKDAEKKAKADDKKAKAVKKDADKKIKADDKKAKSHDEKTKAAEKKATKKTEDKNRAAEKSHAVSTKNEIQNATAAHKLATKHQANEKHHQDTATGHFTALGKHHTSMPVAAEYHDIQSKLKYHEQQYDNHVKNAIEIGTRMRNNTTTNLSETTDRLHSNHAFIPWKGPQKQTIDKKANGTQLNKKVKIASLKTLHIFSGKETTQTMYELLVYTIRKQDVMLFERLFHYTNWDFLGADTKMPYSESILSGYTEATESVVDNIVLHKFEYGRDLLLKNAREAQLSSRTIRRLQEAIM